LVEAIPAVFGHLVRQQLAANNKRVFHFLLHDELVHREDTVRHPGDPAVNKRSVEG
jgi:hypothetical protein